VNDTMTKMHLSLRFLAGLLLCVDCIAAFAQEPAAVDTAPAAAQSESADVPLVIETDPSVRAALELPRRTPADFLRAIGWLIELERPELAKPILDELTTLQLSEAQRAGLVDEFGSAAMLKLARSKELAPAGAEFANSCMVAATAAATDPRRLAVLVAQLTDPSAEARMIARNDLAAAGREGVVATLQALARERVPARRAALGDAAAEMQPLVIGPLLAMLSTNDTAVRAEVADQLARLGVTQAAPLVAGSPAAAEQALADAIARYTAGTPPFALDAANRAEIWHWNDTTKTLSAGYYPAEDARVIWLARLARALAQLRPDNHAYQQQAWLLGLEAAGVVGSTPVSLAGIDTSLVNDILADALDCNYAHAATMTAEELGRRGDMGVLFTVDGQPSSLANALKDSDRHVRFAALRAIMALNPTSPFPGSSHVPEALAWFAGGTGNRRAVVAMPTHVMATDVAGMLAAQELEADAVNNGREAIDRARELADLETIFVDMDISAPEVRQVLYELRTASETGEVPIALLAADGRLPVAQRLASEHKKVFAMPRPHTAEVLGHSVESFRTLAAQDAVAAGRRATQAVQALTWIANLLASDQSFYDLHFTAPAVEAALYRPDTVKLAIAALSELGTPESQQLLADFASERAVPIAARRQAADAFRASAAKFGVLLTTDEILMQFDRYNASATADGQTQQVLGTLLDTIESSPEVSGTD
jgi:CheY-like chemotaxis protein